MIKVDAQEWLNKLHKIGDLMAELDAQVQEVNVCRRKLRSALITYKYEWAYFLVKKAVGSQVLKPTKKVKISSKKDVGKE